MSYFMFTALRSHQPMFVQIGCTNSCICCTNVLLRTFSNAEINIGCFPLLSEVNESIFRTEIQRLPTNFFQLHKLIYMQANKREMQQA